MADGGKETEAGIDSSGNIGGIMSRHKEYEEKVQMEKQENEAVVDEIIKIFQNHNLSMRRIQVILHMTEKESLNKASL